MFKPVHLTYFSDVLCVWAYIGQIRLDELKHKFGEQLEIKYHHVTLFGNTQDRIEQGWKERGGYAGFNQHVLEVAKDFPHIKINGDVWLKTQPKSSGVAHLFLKAVNLLLASGNLSDKNNPEYPNKTLFEIIDWRVRQAFFKEAIDIGQINNLYAIAESFLLPIKSIETLINNGSAMAELCLDMQMKELKKLDGSPTYLLNENRQKLFGNVGYKILEANVLELLKTDKKGQASWC